MILRIVEGGDGFVVEAIELIQEAPVAEAEEVLALSEQGIEARAVPLHAAGAVVHAEGHLRFFGRHVQFFEEAREMRIRDLIVNHEAGVHADLAIAFLHRDGVGVTTDIITGFEEGEVVVLLKKVSAAEA